MRVRLAARAEPGGLRPEAYELAVYLAAGVRSVSGSRAPLTVTRLYPDGWSFDIRRRYASGAQAQAFQGKKEDALQTLERCEHFFPDRRRIANVKKLLD